MGWALMCSIDGIGGSDLLDKVGTTSYTHVCICINSKFFY